MNNVLTAAMTDFLFQSSLIQIHCLHHSPWDRAPALHLSDEGALRKESAYHTHSRMWALSFAVIGFYLLNVTWSHYLINTIHIYFSVFLKCYHNLVFASGKIVSVHIYYCREDTNYTLQFSDFKVLRFRFYILDWDSVSLMNNVLCSASRFFLFHLQQTSLQNCRCFRIE